MYVICPGCKYPELLYSLDGKKGLKSICKSCGKTNIHDGQHKSGKIIIQWLQSQSEIKDAEMTKADMKKAAALEQEGDGETIEQEDATKDKDEDVSDTEAPL